MFALPKFIESLLFSSRGDRTAYLIGAGGIGMSSLGHLLLDAGVVVAGSDEVCNSEVIKLRQRGANIFTGHSAKQVLDVRPDLVVYSSAVCFNNPELQAVRAAGIPVVRRAVMLSAIMHGSLGVCVAGMHGKSTTSALLGYALEQLNANPSYAIGALVPQLRRHGRLSRKVAPASNGHTKNLFVAETDESDGGLVEFQPEYSIVLNIDDEHLDFYGSFERVCDEFLRFTESTKQLVLFCADDCRLNKLLSAHPRSVPYGFSACAAYRAELLPNEESDGRTAFRLWRRGKKIGDFSIALYGAQNVSNATAVVALLSELGYESQAIASAICGFSGVERRQQTLYADEQFKVVDDYAHHPTEIKATIAAAKRLGCRRVLVAFQPHRYSRTQTLLDQFVTAFVGADHVWITDIYSAGEPPIPSITGARLAKAVAGSGCEAQYAGLEGLCAHLKCAMEPGDLILFLGAGDITKIAHAFAEDLKQQQALSAMCENLPALLSSESRVRRNEPLAKKTTLRVGGPADWYVEPASETDLATVLRFCGERQIPITILGRGSNLLIRDGGIRGVVICFAGEAFSRVEVNGERLHCGAGVKLKTVSVEARRHGLTGLEFLEGIPGSVGGALRMNAGAMGSWIFEVVDSIRFIDYAGNIQGRKSSEVYVEYRGCPLFKDHIALGAVLKGQPAPKETIALRMQSFSEKRWDTQPAAPSAGCIFKNPAQIPAGRLIDELGLKGIRVGGAVVSDLHGNFIVNDRNATARDVLNLIEIIKDRAKSARGIDLETEVQIIGDDPA
jgi:UDP-N-acetylmuramate--L-alanine ligase/UDP-N-acetylenolpyruvoylglucosamine reductase